MIFGWIVLTGNGYPARTADDETSVAFFADLAAAERWIEDHPKAQNPYPIELRSAP